MNLAVYRCKLLKSEDDEPATLAYVFFFIYFIQVHVLYYYSTVVSIFHGCN
jgi:hypothetical protein